MKYHIKAPPRNVKGDREVENKCAYEAIQNDISNFVKKSNLAHKDDNI